MKGTGTVQLGRLRLVAAGCRAPCPGCMSEAQRARLVDIGEALTELWEALAEGGSTADELRAAVRDGLEALGAYERGIAAAQGPTALATYDRVRGG